LHRDEQIDTVEIVVVLSVVTGHNPYDYTEYPYYAYYSTNIDKKVLLQKSRVGLCCDAAALLGTAECLLFDFFV
jgi:hypothetical protein